MTEIFTPAILELERQGLRYSDPRSFQGYLTDHQIADKNTASYISVQTLSKLKSDLRQHGYTVFRLGSRPHTTQTHFALAKLQDPSDWSEYFLLDQEIFGTCTPDLFLPNVSIRQLFAFNLLSSLTENSLINLAISSGLLAAALGIETSESLAAPASGHGTSTFEFKPSPEASTCWLHHKGQVEIDALFVGKRHGKETLFVIEAKTSEKFDSLAKYKLVYPVLALQERVPAYIPIVPVYLRTIKSQERQAVSFYIAECTTFERMSEIVAISTLDVVQAQHLVLLGYHDGYADVTQ